MNPFDIEGPYYPEPNRCRTWALRALIALAIATALFALWYAQGVPA